MDFNPLFECILVLLLLIYKIRYLDDILECLVQINLFCLSFSDEVKNKHEYVLSHLYVIPEQ